MSDKQSCAKGWKKIFKGALDADTWGQSIEAHDDYESLLRKMDEQVPKLNVTSDERATLNNIKRSLELRMTAISDGNGIDMNEIKKLVPIFDNLFSEPISSFPIHLKGHPAQSEKPKIQDLDGASDVGPPGSIAGPQQGAPGTHSLSLNIEKIGLKDAQNYIQASLTVSVVDDKGNVIERQDTPQSNQLRPNYVVFNAPIFLTTTMEKLSEGKGGSVFFEFKHYKPKKQYVSVRCFCFMTYDEINRGDGNMICLELYKKPTDFTGKKLNLHTIKKLYLHVQPTITKNT